MYVNDTYSGVRIILLLIGILLVILNLLPDEPARFLVRENGLVESLTAIVYGIAALWLLIMPLYKKGRETGSAGLMVLLLGLRELDFHARFTTMGIFKTRYYISPEVPVGEKIIVSIIVIVIVVIAIRFLRQSGRKFLRTLRAGEIWAVCTALGIGFGIFSKILDSLAEPLRPVVALYHHNPPVSMHVTEELTELAIPLFFLLAAYHLSRQRTTSRDSA